MFLNVCPKCTKQFCCNEQSQKCITHSRVSCLCSKCYAKKHLGLYKIDFIEENKNYRVRFFMSTTNMFYDCWLIPKEEKEAFVLEVL